MGKWENQPLVTARSPAGSKNAESREAVATWQFGVAVDSKGQKGERIGCSL